VRIDQHVFTRCWLPLIKQAFQKRGISRKRTKKSLLLHTATEPEPFGGEKTGPGQYRTSKKIFTIRNGRGMLFAQTVLPEKATIMKIGGRDAGGDYRFLVPNENGVLTNYPPDGQPIKGDQLIEAAPDVGSWRIEVSPTVSSQQDFFLHLLSVADNIPSLRPPTVQNLTSRTAAAVLIEERQLIAFNKGEQPASALSWEMPQRNADLIIVGLLADTNYSMRVISNKSIKMPYTVFASNPGKSFSVPKDPELLSAFNNADILLPDGIGVVLAARILHGSKFARIPGSEFIFDICDIAPLKGYGIFVYGASEEVNSAYTVATCAQVIHLSFDGPGFFGSHTKERMIFDLNRFPGLIGFNDSLHLPMVGDRQAFFAIQRLEHFTHPVSQV
jgi:hypothetical protein